MISEGANKLKSKFQLVSVLPDVVCSHGVLLLLNYTICSILGTGNFSAVLKTNWLA